MGSKASVHLEAFAGRWLCRSYYWAFQRRHNPRRARYYLDLLASQWWGRDRIEAFQVQRLRALLRHAYDHTAYYRRLMDAAGLDPARVRSADDLRVLPVLTKAAIREHGQELRASGGVDPAAIYENHTGGSTGVPLTFWQDTDYRDRAMADIDRNFAMCGYRLGDRQAFLWGSDFDAKEHRTRKGRLKDLFHNMHWIDTFDISVRDLDAIIADLRRWQPRFLVGYVSSVVLAARALRERGVADVRPRAIQTSAETLTPAQRRVIQEAFGGGVFDRYGCREVGNIAHECPAHAGLHLLAENNLTEVVTAGRPAQPGEVGKIVVTNLNNYAMPLIRYENGDMAAPAAGQCACGRGLPLLERVVGRVTDVIRSPSGRLLHGEFFTHLFYKTSDIAQFQVVQTELARLRVAVVPGAGFRQQTLDRVRDLIVEHGDRAFEVEFDVCEQIPPSASGKYRFTRSDLPLSLN